MASQGGQVGDKEHVVLPLGLLSAGMEVGTSPVLEEGQGAVLGGFGS